MHTQKGILISMYTTNEKESQGKHGDRTSSIVWPQRWFSRFRCLPPALVTLVQSLGPTYWKERIDSYKMSCDSQMGARAGTYMHVGVHAQNTSNVIRHFQEK